jgi:hypothetical protein
MLGRTVRDKTQKRVVLKQKAGFCLSCGRRCSVTAGLEFSAPCRILARTVRDHCRYTPKAGRVPTKRTHVCRTEMSTVRDNCG